MNNPKTSSKSSDSLELKELFNTISLNRKILYKSAMIAFFVGVFFIIFTPKVYKTQVRLLAESSSNSPASGLLGRMGGGLSGIDMGSLIGLGGLNGQGDVALTPDLYPEVVKSTSFLIEILQEKIYLPKKDISISLGKYLEEYTKPSIFGWGGYLLNLLKSKSKYDVIQKKVEGEPLNLSQAQFDLIQSLSDNIEINTIKSGGGLTGGEIKIIKVTVEAQDPYVSALLAEKVIANLKQYIINYHTSKAKKDLVFVEARFNETKARYHKAQQALADYDDSNINIILATVNTYRDRLASEYGLSSSLYQGLAQKLEQSQIRVQDKTPVFTVIEPAKVPLQKSKPKTVFTIISLIMIGLFVGVCVILGKEYVLPIFKSETE